MTNFPFSGAIVIGLGWGESAMPADICALSGLGCGCGAEVV